VIATSSRELPVSAQVAWEMLQKSDVQMRISRGFFTYSDRLPDVREEGFTFATRLKLFGSIPTWIHSQRLAKVDNIARELVMDESGLPYRSWQHRMMVTELAADRCRFTDEIRVSSGLTTALAWGFAFLLCSQRTRRLYGLALARQERTRQEES
jgi:hypothetical protein